jgi:hypothetical protein
LSALILTVRSAARALPPVARTIATSPAPTPTTAPTRTTAALLARLSCIIGVAHIRQTIALRDFLIKRLINMSIREATACRSRFVA